MIAAVSGNVNGSANSSFDENTNGGDNENSNGGDDKNTDGGDTKNRFDVGNNSDGENTVVAVGVSSGIVVVIIVGVILAIIFFRKRYHEHNVFLNYLVTRNRCFFVLRFNSPSGTLCSWNAKKCYEIEFKP